MSIDIFCALTERTFHFHWPQDVKPVDWHELGEAVERELGGEFNSFPNERSSRFSITSSKTDNALIDEIGQIIKAHLPPEQTKEARTVFWGHIDPDIVGPTYGPHRRTLTPNRVTTLELADPSFKSRLLAAIVPRYS